MSDKRLIRAASVVALITISGRALGFFRDMTIARIFGATSETDAFLIAWTIPETAAPLLLEGAILFALIPLFARSLQGTPEIRETMGETVSILSGGLAAVSLGVYLLAAPIARILAPGLADHALATDAVRLASATILLFGIAGFLTAGLRIVNIFGVTAAVYLAYNVGILACIFLLQSRLGVLSAALGLSVGAVLMVAIQLPAFLKTFGWVRPLSSLSAEVRVALISFVPIAAFILLRHAQVYVERILGSGLEVGSISRLNYAERIAQVPMSAVVAFAIVSFPQLARSAASKELGEMSQAFHRNLVYVVLSIAPSVAYLVVAADEVVALLFQRGAFNAADTSVTAGVLELYALGLFAQVAIAVAVLPLFSIQGAVSKPVSAAAIGLLATVAVDLALLQPLGVAGLAIGNVVGITVMAVLLLRMVDRLAFPVRWRHLRQVTVKALLAASFAGAIAVGVSMLMLSAPLLVEVLTGAGSTAIAYGAAARLLGVKEIGEVARALVPRSGSVGKEAGQ